jgi:hypothetical protein
MGMLDYVQGSWIIQFWKEIVKAFSHNLKKYVIPLSAFDEKFLKIVLQGCLQLASHKWATGCKIHVN